MINILLTGLFIIFVSFIFAKLEINIEGENGWAKNLPTWVIQPNNVFFRLVLSDKTLTGYHFYLWIFIFTLLHCPFLFIPWNLNTELNIIAIYFLIIIIEDFMWFIFNPKYGIRKFHRNGIPWHKEWFLIVPTSYIKVAIIVAIIFSIAQYLK